MAVSFAADASTVAPLTFDRTAINSSDVRPLLLRHGLSEHPLFTLERGIALAAELPTPWVATKNSRLPLAFGPALGDDGRSGAAVAAAIADGHDKVAMHRLERCPPYTEIVQRFVDGLAPAVARDEGPVVGWHAAMLLSSPATAIPVHFDVTHNVLLQCAGTKRLTVGRFARPVVQQREIGRYFARVHSNPTALPTEDLQSFLLGPGDGIYIPPYTFHWVEVGDQVAVSLAFGFSTAVTMRAMTVHRFNSVARAVGLRPRPPGHSLARDRLKAAAVGRAGTVKRGMRRAARATLRR